MLQFGTDGVRGDAASQLTSEFVVALARAFARATGAARVLVGRDTRESGPRIESDLAEGLAAEGAVCELAGVLPTPGVALLARTESEWAAMISASHNVWSDNGIKFFEPGGTKLSDEHQLAIEALLAADDRDSAAPGTQPGVSQQRPALLSDASSKYRDWLVAQVGPGALAGLHIVLDGANGAAFELAPAAFAMAGAEIDVIGCEPDGRNINRDCGSTHPEHLQHAVVALGADMGLAFDGDADRVVAVDAGGALVDGDQIMAVMALALRARGQLPGDAIVVTVMSNLGLRQAMATAGIRIVETPVGDRHVVAAMHAEGLALGGEQSGHIVFRDHAATGDGILTGLLLAEHVAASGRRLSDLAGVMTRYPQVLRNVRLPGRPDLAGSAAVAAAIARVEADLGDDGRLLVRPSGTEPVVRVMVEAPTRQRADAAAEVVVNALTGDFAADQH